MSQNDPPEGESPPVAHSPAAPAAAGPEQSAALPPTAGPEQSAALPGADIATGELPLVLWAPAGPLPPSRGLGAWALFFAIVGLIAALFVGWGFAINIVAIVTAGVALRRPRESRAVAGWALALGLLGLLYSAGWLAWGFARAGVFG